MQCNIQNELLKKEEWSRIEKQCKIQAHLGEKDKLQDIIEQDTKTLAALGITHDQISDLMDNIAARCIEYSIRNNFKIYELEDEPLVEKIQCALTKNLHNEPAWCIRTVKMFPIFSKSMLVVRVTYGGAETCPFQSPLDKKYHGYEYGDKDWLVYSYDKDSFFYYADLFRHSIKNHNFFEAPSSLYRVNPEDFVKFFDMTKGKNYIGKTYDEQVWSSGTIKSSDFLSVDNFLQSVHSDDYLKKGIKITKIIHTEDYHAALLSTGDMIINSKHEAEIDIFGGSFSSLFGSICTCNLSTQKRLKEEI